VIGKKFIATQKYRRLLLELGGHAIVCGHLQAISQLMGDWQFAIGYPTDRITNQLQLYTSGTLVRRENFHYPYERRQSIFVYIMLYQ
jgi:hypothetical protein